MRLLVNNNILNISINEKVDYNIASSYHRIIPTCKITSFELLQLDFSETTFVTLAGSMYLIFIVHGIVNAKKSQGTRIETVIINCPEQVVSTLLNFGFFKMLGLYGSLRTNPDFIKTSDETIDFWKKNVKNLDINLRSLYWPISNIPFKHGINFELEVRSFYNDFIIFFNSVISLGFIKGLNKEGLDFIERFFYKAINESTKNVWDHSESWGIASIQSNRSIKTTFCLFDFGVGFINSYIKRKGGFQRSTQADKNVLMWLFEEGNTSNQGANHGHGLSILQKFTDMSNGVLLINTDQYSIQYTKMKGLRINEKLFFPGTQIMINF